MRLSISTPTTVQYWWYTVILGRVLFKESAIQKVPEDQRGDKEQHYCCILENQSLVTGKVLACALDYQTSHVHVYAQSQSVKVLSLLEYSQ